MPQILLGRHDERRVMVVMERAKPEKVRSPPLEPDGSTDQLKQRDPLQTVELFSRDPTHDQTSLD
jgi:hypothetical protein